MGTVTDKFSVEKIRGAHPGLGNLGKANLALRKGLMGGRAGPLRVGCTVTGNTMSQGQGAKQGGECPLGAIAEGEPRAAHARHSLSTSHSGVCSHLLVQQIISLQAAPSQRTSQGGLGGRHVLV